MNAIMTFFGYGAAVIILHAHGFIWWESIGLVFAIEVGVRDYRMPK